MTEFVTTGDGSITLLDEGTGELYHNKAGAHTEALEHYVLPSCALERVTDNYRISILDVCFGLGYNTFVLLETLLRANVKGFVEVIAIEHDPKVIATTSDVLLSDKFERLRNFFGSRNFASSFRQISSTHAGLQISLDLRLSDVRVLVPSLNYPFDLIYHDPFSPRRMPELWTIDLFAQYHRLLEQRNGAVLTYSKHGATRGGLKQTGFTLYKTMPVGEKKGGTLGSVGELRHMPNNVQKLSDEELSRLDTASGIPYRDSVFSRGREDIRLARQTELGL